MKSVIGMSDPNVMFKGSGSLCMKSEIWKSRLQFGKVNYNNSLMVSQNSKHFTQSHMIRALDTNYNEN